MTQQWLFLMVVAVATPLITMAQMCYDKGVRCPRYRSYCTDPDLNDHVTDSCPASCNKCNYVPLQMAEDREANDILLNCCQYNLMNATCMDLCRYDTKQEDVLQAATEGRCNYQDARVWVMCASDGNDNSDCCRDNGVEERCISFCQGNFDATSAFHCFAQYLDVIETCHRKAVKSLWP